MDEGPPDQVTRMLNQMAGRDSDPATAKRLLDCVYDQLHEIALRRMAGERPGHTLQATALVNEAYVRLMGRRADVPWRDRGHFYIAAAEAMRRILVDHARRNAATKRGGARKRMVLNVCDLAATDDPKQILALDDAILRLQEEDAAAAEIVRLRFYAGLTVEQTAAAIGVSPRTVKREWTYARAKLFRSLESFA